jgi:hypothetical protein
MGGFLVSAGFTSGVVVVAICISLKALAMIIAKPHPGRWQNLARQASASVDSSQLDDPTLSYGAGPKTPHRACQTGL